jgi:hypothetical protein
LITTDGDIFLNAIGIDFTAIFPDNFDLMTRRASSISAAGVASSSMCIRSESLEHGSRRTFESEQGQPRGQF